jgi:hypothetical protein
VTRFNVPGKSSKFKNVSLDRKMNLWCAKVNKDKVKHSVGKFVTELEAAIAADTKSKELFGVYAVTNESLGLLPQGWEQIVLRPVEKQRDFRNNPTSRFKGVSLDRSCKSRPWRARLSIPGQGTWESWYETQEKAAAEFDAMAVRTHGPKYKTNKAMGLL